MSFDYQPVLQGDNVELRPLRAEDFDELCFVAADPLIWEQHPVRNRHEEATFQAFFQEALTSGGTLTAIDASSSQRAVEEIGGIRIGARPDADGRDSYVYEITASAFRLRGGL